MPLMEDRPLPSKLKIFLYGESGSGKTWFIGSAPTPMYYFQFDINGGQTISGTPGIEYDDYYCADLKTDPIRVEAAIGRKVRELQRNCPFATVAFDSFTLFSEMLRGKIIGANGRWGKEPEMREQDWGTLGDLSTTAIRDWLRIDANIIITSHGRVAIHELPGNQKEILHLITPDGLKFPQKVSNYFDEVYRISARHKGSNNPNDYRIMTRSDRDWSAKSRLNVYNKKTRKLEHVLDPEEPADFTLLYEKLRAARKAAGFND